MKNNYNFYKREIKGFNTWQRLIVKNKNFYEIENIENGAHYTSGFIPIEFESGKKIKHGFLKKYGFKKYYPGNLEMEIYEQKKELKKEY